METVALDIHRYFDPVLGTRPWRAKPGVGSFLTFEFGKRIKAQGHYHGSWHLWIYLANWNLFHGDRKLVDSDSDRTLMKASIRRLEDEVFREITLNGRRRQTIFYFGNFRLEVKPADYLKDADHRDKYWLFFMPNNEVLSAGPSGFRIEREKAPRRTEEVRRSYKSTMDSPGRRIVSLEN